MNNLVLTTLSDMPDGSCATVQDIQETINPSDALRLQELGITSGAKIQLLRRSPSGDPLEIKIRGLALSIPKNQAQAIHVKTD